MGLANFLDRAALAASQVLFSFDRTAFEAVLSSRLVGILFDGNAAGSIEGVTTLELSVNLLARLFPRLAIITTGKPETELVSRLHGLARGINPEIDLSTNQDGLGACLVVGRAAAATPVPAVYVGSAGFLVHLSTHGPVGCGDSSNPFGASAAACFGCANIFRMLFGDQLPYGKPDSSWTMSLLDLESNSDPAANPALGEINLGEAHLVGLGAIGNGVIWTLARVSQLQGVLHLIDADSVDLGNLQRYVLTRQQDVGKPKVRVAAEVLSSSHLRVKKHRQRWGEYLQSRNDWRLPLVAAAVDSARDRHAIQASLPQWIVNAWTQPGDLGVSRHSFAGDQACLMCLYFPDGLPKNEDAMIAEAIGLPDARQEVAALLYTGAAVGEQWVERIATALQIPVERLLRFSDWPLRSFYTEVVCGGIMMSLGGSPEGRSQATVPLAFQSALAGVLLASEMVIHAAGLRKRPPPVTTKIDLLRPLGQYLSVPASKHPSGRCICQDRDYVKAYEDKYGSGT